MFLILKDGIHNCIHNLLRFSVNYKNESKNHPKQLKASVQYIAPQKPLSPSKACFLIEKILVYFFYHDTYVLSICVLSDKFRINSMYKYLLALPLRKELIFSRLPKGSLFIWVQRGLNGHGEARRKTLAPPPEGRSRGCFARRQCHQLAPPVLSSVSAPGTNT